jgi:hypothetical protein
MFWQKGLVRSCKIHWKILSWWSCIYLCLVRFSQRSWKHCLGSPDGTILWFFAWTTWDPATCWWNSTVPRSLGSFSLSSSLSPPFLVAMFQFHGGEISPNFTYHSPFAYYFLAQLFIYSLSHSLAGLCCTYLPVSFTYHSLRLNKIKSYWFFTISRCFFPWSYHFLLVNPPIYHSSACFPGWSFFPLESKLVYA